jgi:hypothetical protein
MEMEMEMEEESVASSVRQERLPTLVPTNALPPSEAEIEAEAAHPVDQIEDAPLVEDDSFEQEQHGASMPEPSSSSSSQRASLPETDPETAPPVPTSTTTTAASTENLYNLMDHNHNHNDHQQLTSWAISLALILFGGLVGAAVLLAFLVLRDYGFIAISALCLVILLFVGLALFVHYILKQDARLEPVRRQLQGFAEHVQQLVQEEMVAFQSEWGHYDGLLTNGNGGGDDEDAGTTTAAPNDQENPIICPSLLLEPKRKKSVLFRMIRPFLNARKRVFGRRQSSPTKKDTELTGTCYQPPVTPTTTTPTSLEDGVTV